MCWIPWLEILNHNFAQIKAARPSGLLQGETRYCRVTYRENLSLRSRPDFNVLINVDIKQQISAIPKVT